MVNRQVPPTDKEFYSALRSGLERANKRVGARILRAFLDLSKDQLGNVLQDSGTNATVPWNALLADESALDDVAALYGVEIWPAEPQVDHGDALAVLAEILSLLAATPNPTHQRLLQIEPKLREGAAVLKDLLAKCRTHRGTTR